MGDIKRRRRGSVNWKALTAKERRKLIVDCGVYNVEAAIGSAAARCSTAVNYARTGAADVLNSAGELVSGAAELLTELGEVVKPSDTPELCEPASLKGSNSVV